MTRRIFAYLRPYKKRLAAIFLISICVSAFTLADAWVLGRITDAIFYRTQGLPIGLNVKESQNKEFNLNLVKDTPWTSGERNILMDKIKHYGLNVITAGLEKGNLVAVRVEVPLNVSKDPVKMLTDLQKHLQSKFSHLQVYLPAQEQSKPTDFRLFPNVYTIFILPFIIILVYLMRGIFSYFQNYMVGSIGQKIVMKLRNQIYENLQNLSISYFEKNKTPNQAQYSDHRL